jgi:hypothetical protein
VEKLDIPVFDADKHLNETEESFTPYLPKELQHQFRPIIEMTGAHMFNEVFFDDVRLPAENLVGEANRGWGCWTAATSWARRTGSGSTSARSSPRPSPLTLAPMPGVARPPRPTTSSAYRPTCSSGPRALARASRDSALHTFNQLRSSQGEQP